MNSLKIYFSLIGAGILNLVPLSAQAQLVINSTQNAAINGDNNQVTQVINQTIIYQTQNPRFPRPGNMHRYNRGQDDDDRRGRNNGRRDDREGGRYHEGRNNRD
jgi:hypothetical protein